MKIPVTVRTNKVGSECSDELEVPDNFTEEEIAEAAHGLVGTLIEWDWKPIEGPAKEGTKR